jgi:hypothetical protein
MNDQAIEQEIKAKGLIAPRVTLADLEANIADTEIVKHVSKTGQVLRWAVLTTQNGFAVVGKPSVAVSPENDNTEVGEKIAIDNARNELWPLMGYALKQQLHEQQQPTAPPDAKQTTDREDELEELVRSACAIAERKGASTAWDRFTASARALGLNGVTARTYRILPSDTQ